MKIYVKVISIITLLLFLILSIGINADNDSEYSLSKRVKVKWVKKYQKALERIAKKNNGNRSAGTSGYDMSTRFVSRKLSKAGYDVTLQHFDFPFFEEISDPTLDQTAPFSVSYPPNDENGFITMTFSAKGNAVGEIEPVDILLPPGNTPNSSSSGCEAEDFSGFNAGNIALIQRGSCSFYQKAINAQNAGAIGVIIFNEGQPGRTNAISGTLGQADFTIPVVFASFAIGSELFSLNTNDVVTVDMNVDVINETRTTQNIIAELDEGDPDNVIIVGAHLDSVTAGPGINDNGSGSAAILETAVKLARSDVEPLNKIRFAFWGAEELGLIGSEFYVENLTDIERDAISFYLNFDMIGSPNYVRFVFDGDGSDTNIAGPPGSEIIEQFLVDAFAQNGLASAPTALSGRSDYAPFMDINIPIGGLFTGAGGIKTPEEAEIYGGTAGEPYDANYHTDRDTVANINIKAEKEMLQVIAAAVEASAMGDLVVPKYTSSQFNTFSRDDQNQREYFGPFLVR